MARGVLECGSPLPLLQGLSCASHQQSARGLAHSKSWRRFGVRLWLVLLLSAFSFQPSVFSQSYSIDWFTIDGGGGTSTGGVYSISGTIGQPDAGGPMTGGNYSLTGGYWSLLSKVQTPDAPLLTITLTATNTVIISWPSSFTGFTLQQNAELNTLNWAAPSESIADNGTTKSIIVSPSAGARFYRLVYP